MSSPTPEPQITQLLLAWNGGDPTAMERLAPIVYSELRRLAQRYLSKERPEHRFQATELVNEAYLKLIDCKQVQWQDRSHFFALSAQLMRRILVDLARSGKRLKRGEGLVVPLVFEECAAASETDRSLDWLELDVALKALEVLDSRKAKVVELRFFAGLSIEETAEVLDVSTVTVRRDWQFARAWLRRELAQTKGSS
ncbi:MAG: sigma-70 family RNA polymerase sigma factor [Acidobacteria bacterium]|nr:sigma-70 family RNA polymerase sigma factor [Acidobacteriota bacterium]